MADILAALEQLDREEKKAKPAARRSTSVRGRPATSGKPSYEAQTRRTARPQTRPRPVSLPPPSQSSQNLQLPATNPTGSPRSVYAASERSPSQGPDSRRISFADPPRPGARKIHIPTRTDNPSSGFPFDPRLNKYGVTEDEWNRFSEEVVEAADIPGPSWAWPFHRSKVVKRLKKELQYDGELKRLLRRWNKGFRMKRFQVWLELPVKNSESDLQVLDGEDEFQAKRDAKRFRMLIMQNVDKSPSVYSRSSSLTRTVSGEAATAIANRALAEAAQKEPEPTGDGEHTLPTDNPPSSPPKSTHSQDSKEPVEVVSDVDAVQPPKAVIEVN